MKRYINRDTKYYIENICHQFPDLHNQIPVEFQVQKQPPVVFFKENFLKKFAIFTGKHLCWSLFLIDL